MNRYVRAQKLAQLLSLLPGSVKVNGITYVIQVDYRHVEFVLSRNVFYPIKGNDLIESIEKALELIAKSNREKVSENWEELLKKGNL